MPTFDLANLPNDPELLQQMLVDVLRELQKLRGALGDRDERIQALEQQLSVLRRMTFGRRSEKYDPEQQRLFVPNPPPATATEEPVVLLPPEEPKSAKKGHGRQKQPKSLSREREVHTVPADSRRCSCGSALDKIGEKVSELLDYKPASIYVRELVQETYGCPACHETVITAELPARPIDRGLPGAGLLAHVITSKYQDHLPLHRLEGIFERQGANISRSTMADWVDVCSDLLSPLVAAMKEDQFKSEKIHTDDTPVPVQDRTRKGKKIRDGRLWVYTGDEKHPHVVFDYTPDRSRAGPSKFLDGYEGYLQADAYKGYKAIYAGHKVFGVACWAHARRKFFDAQTSDPARATLALSFIRSLYKVESDAADQELDAAGRKALRLARSKPILDDFLVWLQRESTATLPKSAIGQAIGYALRQWPDLVRYLERGELSIDNNEAEREMRHIAVGRKNWVFAGSDEGGRRAAILYSVMATCRRHEVDPFHYLKDVLDRVSTHPASRVREVLPDLWKKLFASPAAEQGSTQESTPAEPTDPSASVLAAD